MVEFQAHNPGPFAINRYPLEGGETNRRGYYVYNEPRGAGANNLDCDPPTIKEDEAHRLSKPDADKVRVVQL